MDDVEQVCMVCFEYGHRSENCTEDREDFKLIGPIAAFIAARLQYVLPPCNSGIRGKHPVSTIRVDQHKEKFWNVRIYCTLADADLVKEKWAKHGGEGEPTSEFKRQCLRLDVQHYRKCYLDQIALIPRLKRRIRSQADYSELLLDDVNELDARTHQLELQDGDALKFFRSRYGVETNDELRQLLRSFYDAPALGAYASDA